MSSCCNQALVRPGASLVSRRVSAPYPSILRRYGLDLLVEGLKGWIIFGDSNADRFQAFFQFGLFARRECNDLAAAVGPAFAQLNHLIERALPAPRLQLARLIDDGLAKVRWHFVEPGLAQRAERDEQRVVCFQ